MPFGNESPRMSVSSPKTSTTNGARSSVELRALVLAVGLHVAFGAAVIALPVTRPSPKVETRAEVPSSAELAVIDLTSSEPARKPEREPTSADLTKAELAALDLRGPSSRGPSATEPLAPSEPPSDPVDAPAASTPSPSPSAAEPARPWAFDPTRAPGSAPGSTRTSGPAGSTNPFFAEQGREAMHAPSAKETTAEAKARVDHALTAEARARETELGLGPDGPVRTALTSAMYGTESPVGAKVVFEVRADKNGTVLSIDVLSADTNLQAFRTTAARAKTLLAGKTLRLPSSAKGAVMKLEVSSAWKLPSGHDPGTQVELFGRALKKGEGNASTKVVLLAPPRVRCISPDDPKNDLKLPLCGLEAPLFGTDGDPADIGAKARRIVHTRLIESTML
jgi:hypothetical protein